jgi:hypothetical protein
MRRILFGGIGLSLGLFANTAAGQDARAAQPPVRAARLGVPTAVPEAAPVSRGATPDEGVTPAGLRARLWGTPVQGTPIPGAPSDVQTPGGIIYGAPIPGTIITGDQPPMGGAVIPAPRQIPGGAPSVTETRNADGTPVKPPAGSILVPSMLPGGTYVSPPGLESPLFCDPTPGVAAVGRVRGCSQWYTAAEYLMWWTRSTTLPPLITTSAPQFFGIPGLGNTTTVFGNSSFGDTFHSGGRLTLGRWFGDGQCRGIEGRLFFIDQSNSSFTATTNQFPVLARPFINVNDPAGAFSEVVGDPARGVGGVNVNMQHSLWGAEVNYRRFLCGNPCARIDALIGYRYIGMKDQLSITENFVSTGANATTVGGVPVAVGVVNDTFRTENHFNGGQIGLAGQLLRGRWSLDGRATVAFGNLTQLAEISGGQTLGLANGAVTNFAGGLLALPGANIGRYTQNKFCVVPEVGVNFGYQVTSRMRFFVGYNFLYIGNALRPEGLINQNIDVARIPNFPVGSVTPLPGIAQPAPQFHLSDYFVQGISFGVQFRW